MFREETDQQIEFNRNLGRAISRLNRLRKRFMSERLRPYGLSGPLYMFIITLDRKPGSSQEYLTDHFYMDKGNVARGAKRLEEMGYIRRETDPEDRRQYNLFLTDKGKALAPVISGLLGEWSRIMSKDMSDEDRHTAMVLLDKMLENGKGFFTDSSQANP